jgi:uncharacterized protein YybS (DUF2232 family)
LLLLVAVGSFVAVTQHQLGISWWKVWQQEFARSMDRSLQVYQQLGINQQELVQTAAWLRRLFVDAIVGWMVLLCGFFSVLLYGWQRRWISPLVGKEFPKIPFRLLRVPDYWIWGFLLTLGLLLLGNRGVAWSDALGWNALIIFANIYFLEGIAIVLFYCHVRRVRSSSQLLILLAMGLLPSLVAVVMLIGLFDTWFNWRRFAKPISEGPR